MSEYPPDFSAEKKNTVPLGGEGIKGSGADRTPHEVSVQSNRDSMKRKGADR